MSTEIAAELIKIIPTILWVGLIAGLALLFYGPIKRELLPNISNIKAFGVEATFIHQQLDEAAKEVPVGTPEERSQVARRAERLAAILQGAQILLVNDVPQEMWHVINILRSLKIQVDVAQTTEQALTLMNSRDYDVVISDMRRGDVKDEGQRFLNETVKRGINRPTIFTVAQLEPDRGIPPYAFGITNRLDEALNLVFDILERTRG